MHDRRLLKPMVLYNTAVAHLYMGDSFPVNYAGPCTSYLVFFDLTFYRQARSVRANMAHTKNY